MPKSQPFLPILIGLLLYLPWVAHGGTLLNFEDLPDTNVADFCGGGGVNVGRFYSGVGIANIGPDVFGLNGSCGVSGYPPSSGSINLFSEDDFATIAFSSPVSSVSLYYVSLDFIQLTAYDGVGNTLGATTGAANTDGTTGIDSVLSLDLPNISYLTLGNTGLADEYTFDDLSFTPQTATPEPASPGLLMLGCFFLWLRVRRVSRGQIGR